jgi:hypothetical protein
MHHVLIELIQHASRVAGETFGRRCHGWEGR